MHTPVSHARWFILLFASTIAVERFQDGARLLARAMPARGSQMTAYCAWAATLVGGRFHVQGTARRPR